LLATFLIIFVLSQTYFPYLYLLLPLSLSIILTLSKTAIFALFLTLLPSTLFPLFINLSFLLSLYPLIVSSLPSSFFSTPFFLSLPTTISQRLTLSRPFISIFKQNFLTGTGLRSYLFSLPQNLSPSSLLPANLQPVHSLTALSFIELGLPLVFIIYILKIKNFSLKIKISPLSKKLLFSTLLVVFFTASLDHYWWTLPQNQLILALDFCYHF